MADFYADKYFNGRYFAPRYWQSSDGSGATIGEMVAALSGAGSLSGTISTQAPTLPVMAGGGRRPWWDTYKPVRLGKRRKRELVEIVAERIEPQSAPTQEAIRAALEAEIDDTQRLVSAMQDGVVRYIAAQLEQRREREAQEARSREEAQRQAEAARVEAQQRALAAAEMRRRAIEREEEEILLLVA